MFNSTGWGQIDSLYTSFLLLCVYFLLKEKPFYAMLMFGVAFSFKSQSVFLLPFLGIMFLKGKINWYHFFYNPSCLYNSCNSISCFRKKLVECVNDLYWASGAIYEPIYERA
ncbi:MAG: hypothetical protein UZ14_CFX002002665 [Chloroflexi bacterium OLB14]|nr:MAG: hypothetical protein UZ14_CFX002002665 [Chloroflexi bacterium OLB14]